MEEPLLVDNTNFLVMSKFNEVMSVQLIVVIIAVDSSIGLLVKKKKDKMHHHMKCPPFSSHYLQQIVFVLASVAHESSYCVDTSHY